MSHRFLLAITGIIGLIGVVLGALGAHALHVDLAQRGMAITWETAVIYQLFHTLALLGLGAFTRDEARVSGAWAWAAWGWLAGIICFSGSLYLLALGGPRMLGPVTPLGGLAFIVGWGAVIVAAFRRKPANHA